MATLRENAQYFRQVIRERMSQMLASIAYYRRIFFEQALICTTFILTKIGQGFRLGYKATRALLSWIVFDLPHELIQLTSFVFRQLREFLFDLFTIIKPCFKWLAKHSLHALSKLLGIGLGMLMATSDLAIEAIMFVLKHTVGALFPSLFDTLSQKALTENSVNCNLKPATKVALKMDNGFTPHYQKSLLPLSQSLFPDEMSKKRASLTP